MPRKKIVVKWFPLAPTAPATSEPDAPSRVGASADPAGAPAPAAAPPECDCAACKAACGCGATADAGGEPQPTGASDAAPTDGAGDDAAAQEFFELAAEAGYPVPRTLVTTALEQASSEEEFGAFIDAIEPVFKGVVASNVATSTPIAIPASWATRIKRYALANPRDGAILLRALARRPHFRRNGWIMKVVKGADAMTLDRNVFATGPLTLGTYVHELVHVTQYAVLRPTAFLISYFGVSAAVIAWRFVRRQPLNVMRSSPHETRAYALAARFEAWHQRTYRVSAGTLRA